MRRLQFSLLDACAFLADVLRIVCLVNFVLLAISGQALGETKGIYLGYSSTAGCPSRAQFEAQVRARTTLAQFVDTPGAGRFFTVYAGVNEGLAVGRVTSGHGDEVGSAREVSSLNCEDVVSALALIVALAIDPNASLAPVLPSVSVFPSEPPVASLATPNPTKDSRSETSVATGWPNHQISLVSTVQSRDVSVQDLRRAPAIAWTVGVRTSGSLWFGSTTVPMASLAASIEGEDLRATFFAPSVRLSAERTVSATLHPPLGGGAQFALTRARLDLCPLRVPLATSLVLRPCAFGDGGRLTGTGLREGPVVDALTRQRPWVGIGESARFQLQLGRGWQSEIEVGMMEPLWRDIFVFNFPGSRALGGSQVAIIRAPLLIPRLSLGIALRFW